MMIDLAIETLSLNELLNVKKEVLDIEKFLAEKLKIILKTKLIFDLEKGNISEEEFLQQFFFSFKSFIFLAKKEMKEASVFDLSNCSSEELQTFLLILLGHFIFVVTFFTFEGSKPKTIIQ